MRRIHLISRMPEQASVVTTDVKITFIISMLEVSLPLFRNKDPQNPLPTTTPSTSSGS